MTAMPVKELTVDEFKEDFKDKPSDVLFSIAANPSAKQAAREAAASLLIDQNNPRVNHDSVAAIVGYVRNKEKGIDMPTAARETEAEKEQEQVQAGFTTASANMDTLLDNTEKDVLEDPVSDPKGDISRKPVMASPKVSL